ncbi:MAG: threonine aldolase family protein [Armatimonadetes bacterium]|nr:threonine aldolase family protein [Armatimonadota bacterium]
MAQRVIDLRSDTVTRPDAAMLAAMAAAELGDDGQEGDPTTRRLQERAAELMGKEAALFVPSGTMANLLAMLCQTSPGDEMVLERGAHVYNFEFNGLGALAGLVAVPLDGRRGHLSAESVRSRLAADVPRGPGPTLLWLENTANLAGGTVQTVAETAQVAEVAHAAGMRVHLDGARVLNAATALGCSPADLCADVDTVGFCLSKGLGCPVGSLLCGPAELIERAWSRRRQLGGSLRQSGILAAAGLVALDTRIARLADDHANARWLAERLAGLPGIDLDPAQVETNIVWFACADQDWPRRCREAGVLISGLPDGRCRCVTHADVSAADVAEASERMRACL